MKKEKFSVTGMTCAACSAGIEKSVCRLNGVEQAEVSLMGESMQVTYDENKLTNEEIIDFFFIDRGFSYNIRVI